MSFKDLTLKKSYTSEKNDILNEFYIPVLKEAIDYKRVAGYFSSSSFYIAARGISQFVINGGHMQLIINIQLSEKDYEQITQSLISPGEIIENFFFEDLKELENACVKDHAAVLGWMIANGLLEIKVGYIKDPVTATDILHQKVGILKDTDGNLITFSGSNNESAAGWMLNSEKFKVFCSWEPNTHDYINQDIDDFEQLWNNDSAKTGVVPFPEAVKKKLIHIAPHDKHELKKIIDRIEKEKQIMNCHHKIELREYQNEAIKNWIDNGYQGMFEMATGTGKTYTAVGAIKELLKKENTLLIVISCPFLHLIPQWENSMVKSGVVLPSIHASSKDSKWVEKFGDKLLDMKLNRLDAFVVYTTHDTISSDKFMNIISELKCPILLIGDEVHGMGSTDRMNGLLSQYTFKLGLSATPNRYFDDAGTQELFRFFKKVVYSFDLHRAITEIDPATGQTFLCPYEYHPIFVELTITEMDKYIKISKEIAILYAKKKKTVKDEIQLEFKQRQRADIVKNAENKLPIFSDLIDTLKLKKTIKHTLVYCSPQQIVNIQNIIREKGRIIQHKFTSDEDATKKSSKFNGLTEREFLLDNFDNGVYDVLVAIKCLDEGVDVPSTQTAILVSSTGNPKEYIQRRGRVLRRYPGKDKAIIYDLIVIPDLGLDSELADYERKIVESQFNRIEEFVKESLNYSEVSRNLFKIKLRYKLLGGIKNGEKFRD
ncbi:DEAD/DEAH box helicase [Candidatus Woesearchaeota archaeon]|nr:MAG: DEAD/DEAH box helicase [Candidatus Woesearchaeota archaeon]